MILDQTKSLRKLFIPLLKRFNFGKISIKHHYTHSKFVLDAFLHKGYWYHGKKREIETMSMFKRIIKPGFNLIEVGGHIGYITNFFSNLVQTNGSVYVFEPGTNNLPYLKENIKDLTNVTLIEKAISDSNGTAKFYIENISGQNNSLLPDYGKLVLELSYVKNIKKETEVETITLDSFCQTCGISPDFIKIDIEGAELLAVQGMINLLKRNPPMLMIEITKNSKTVYEILRNLNYVLLTPTGEKIEISNVHYENTFCFHTEKHKQLLQKILVK